MEKIDLLSLNPNEDIVQPSDLMDYYYIDEETKEQTIYPLFCAIPYDGDMLPTKKTKIETFRIVLSKKKKFQNTSKTYECSVQKCNQKFETLLLFQTHQLYDHSHSRSTRKFFYCLDCANLVFKNKNDLNKHIITFHFDPIF